MQRPIAPFLALALGTFLAGCGTGQTLDSLFTEFECSTSAECEAGWECREGYCQRQFVDLDASMDTAIIDLCDCGDEEACCDNLCVDLMADNSHCGACGVGCGFGESCVDGACACGTTVVSGGPVCTGADVCCNEACANPLIDSSCCGSARLECTGDQFCAAGACACGAGHAACGSANCDTNILTDAEHCGDCGAACEGSQACVGGRCACGGAPCAVDESCCTNAAGALECVADSALASHPQHCGGCGIQCAVGQTCENGVCVCGGSPACTGGEVCCSSGGTQACALPDDPQCSCGGAPCASECCNDVCIDTLSDVDNCGGCGAACPDGAQTCEFGNCICPPGTVGCEGNTICVDPVNNDDHCGTCGNACGADETCCDIGCQNIANDPANCGACGNVCPDGLCRGGACIDADQIVALDAGESHVCAVKASGATYCWGAGGDGRIGDGEFSTRETPTLVPGLAAVTLAAGERHTCAIDVSGDVWCWGDGDYQQLAPGTSTSPTPIQVVGLPAPAIQVSAGERFSCALLNTAEVYCWGQDEDDVLGTENITSAGFGLPEIDGTPIRLNSDDRHSCVVLDTGMGQCWGRDRDGRLGYAESDNYNGVPIDVALLTDIDHFSMGRNGTLALQGTDVYGWGKNDNDILGPIASGQERQPVLVQSGFVLVDRGLNQTACGIRTTGEVACWGRDDYDMLGPNAPYSSETPIDMAVNGATLVVVGQHFACAATSREVYCWGRDNNGQLGNGPPRIQSEDPVLAIFP